ncbi:MAG: DUF2298 domain-containing protein [Candidatus Micrarchaeia archaeon]
MLDTLKTRTRPLLILWALVALGLLHESLALLTGAAFSFFISGFLLLKALKINIGSLETIALSILSSILVSAHAAYATSLVLGYSQESILLSFALSSLLVLFVDVKKLSLPKVEKEKLPPATLALGVFALLYFVFATTLWVPTQSGIRVGGWNWSDLFAHMPIIQSVNEGNFPPQTPFFSGTPLVYHWFSDLHTAMLSKITSIHPTTFIQFENALYSTLLILFTYSLAVYLTKNKKTALIAAFLLLFAGSFSYLNFFQDLANNGDAIELVKKTPYDNNWKYFQVPSVLGGYMIVQRPQMVGLPTLVAIALLVALALGEKDDKKMLLAGIMTGLLAPFQYYAFASAGLIAGLFLINRFFSANPQKMLKDSTKNWKTIAAFAIPSILLATPFVHAALTTTTTAGNLDFKIGWLSLQQGKIDQLQGFLENPLLEMAVPAVEFIIFYFANFGLVFILALIGLFAISNKEVRHKRVLFLWMLAMFLIPNLFSFSGTQWDMGKFFVYMMVPTSILAALVLTKAWNIHRIIKPFVLILIFLSILTPLLFLTWTVQSTWQGLSWQEHEAGKWIEKNTAQKSVFLAYQNHISPIDAVAGRFRITGYSSWMNNYGLKDYQKREQDIRRAYCSSAQEAQKIAIKYSAQYVYVGSKEREKFTGCDFEFETSGLFEKIYDKGAIQIYFVKQ